MKIPANLAREARTLECAKNIQARTVNTAKLNKDQVKQIHILAKEIIADWEKIDNKNEQQIKKRLVAAVTDEQDGESLCKFFSDNHRVARLPTGIYATSLSK